MAYVIAHEFGHHVQSVMGISDEVQREVATDGSLRNELSTRQDLQADRLAGVWAHSSMAGVEPGDIDEALTAADVGDDQIQAFVSGRIDPQTWTHGSSKQRQTWFSTGHTSGSVADCDTFK